MPRVPYWYLDETVDVLTEAAADRADALASRWPLGPLDLYDDPLLDREPVGGDPYWAGDLEW